jgi:hypothetical protein
MSDRKVMVFLLLVFLLSAIACTRIPEAPTQDKGTLGTEELPALDSVPSAWGPLTAVTTTPLYPGWFQLWFQDQSGKIRMVRFDSKNHALRSSVSSIPRK